MGWGEPRLVQSFQHVATLKGGAGQVAASPLQDHLKGDTGLEVHQNEPWRQLVEVGDLELGAGGADVLDGAVSPKGQAITMKDARRGTHRRARFFAALDVLGSESF